MRFEVKNALLNLDRPMPAYFRGEIFAHGQLKTRAEALAALKGLDPRRKSVRVLIEMLRLV